MRETQESDMGHTERIAQLRLIAIAATIIVIDQLTKAWVRANLPLHVSWNPIAWLDPIVTLTHVQNTGAAFGLLPSLGGAFAVVAVAVVAMILLFHRRLAHGSLLLQLTFGLQLGGAIGNLIDRIARGYVTDFVDLRWWPVFNVADSALVVGTILLGIYALFLDREVREPAPERAPDEASV
jgi:signal peptidase II